MEDLIVRPMNGGSDLHSYTKNSTVQRQMIEATNGMIKKACEELDVKTILSSKTVRIADLGCSTGPNTFLAIQTIIDSLEHKFSQERVQSSIDISEAINLEYQVFFNDIASNDFNQLFASLPRDRKYFATGVPGDFHGPLFPKESLHFVHSSYSVHWLSMVPKEVTDKSSLAWNKGRIYYSNSTEEVAKAYEAQFSKDMDKFLEFRAQELVDGGLMAFIIGGRQNGLPHSEAGMNKGFELVEYALANMAKEGKVSHEKLDSFNIPLYNASPEEVESAVKRNGCFIIKTLENLEVIPEIPPPKFIASPLRAILEGTIKEHFGDEISNELFDTVLPKFLMGSVSALRKPFELTSLFVVLKRVKSNE